MIAGYAKQGGRRVPLLVDERLRDGEFRVAGPTPQARAAGYASGFVVASPVTWSWNVALHIAAAFRPEGIP